MYTDDVEFHAVLSALSDGDQDAARRIYERFIDRLVVLASSSLDKKNQAKIDPQSVAHSALMSFFGGQTRCLRTAELGNGSGPTIAYHVS